MVEHHRIVARDWIERGFTMGGIAVSDARGLVDLGSVGG